MMCGFGRTDAIPAQPRKNNAAEDEAEEIPVSGESAQTQELADAIAESPLEEKPAQTATSEQAAKEPKMSSGSLSRRKKQGRKRLDPSGKLALIPAQKP
ncbi:hypothetical protein BBJ28_00022578, partial [Nothophytophthora sp. Chile5]